VIVRTANTAHRVRGEVFIRESQRGEDLNRADLASQGMQQIVQSAVCHPFHALMQRVCRWLLANGGNAHGNTRIAIT
jgi:hypothetical protein